VLVVVAGAENKRFWDKSPDRTRSKVEFLELASSLSPTEFLGLSIFISAKKEKRKNFVSTLSDIISQIDDVELTPKL
jgi:hypothetical protein